MRTPLEHEADVPEEEEGEECRSGGEGGATGTKELCGAIEENGETEDEKGRERNEKAVAVGRDAGPDGVTGDEEVKGQEGGEQWSADARLVPPEKEESKNREKKNGSPGEQAVIGREEHVEEGGDRKS